MGLRTSVAPKCWIWAPEEDLAQGDLTLQPFCPMRACGWHEKKAGVLVAILRGVFVSPPSRHHLGGGIAPIGADAGVRMSPKEL